MARHLVVDWIRCRGHGLCAELAPESVHLDDWGFPLVHSEVPEDAVGHAKRAVSACPSAALRLVDDRS